MMVKERLHQLVDALPEQELLSAQRYLEFLQVASGDPVLRALLGAPEDDEPETTTEAEAVREARHDLAAGRVVTHAEARRRLLGSS